MGQPGVLLLHDWYGVLPHAGLLGESLRAAGMTPVVVDLYDGQHTTDADEAESLMEELAFGTAQEKVLAAVRELRHEHTAPRIGAVGFSMGGMIALRLAGQGAFDAVVAYYAALGPGETVPLPCPVQLHLAAIDDWDPPDVPEVYSAALRASGGPVEVHTYPGTEHSFANTDVRYADAAAAEQAWTRTVAFLSKTLGATSP